ncbi:MAG: DUF805 domain-containing protein [Sphingomonadaceae bacterium]|nr:DUF805 domain-containing protein [Sphingomonadaceae bacterium]
MEWMILPFKRYADFTGRSRRMEFWMFRLLFYVVLTVFIGLMIAGFVVSDLGEQSGNRPEDISVMVWIGLAGAGIWYLACIIPSIAVCMRRFHDQDKSGWMWLIYFIPYVGWLVVVVFMCIEGTRGENQYGADPKDPSRADIFA